MASSASENRLVLSKIATNGKHGENSPYFDHHQNPFHPTENPGGVIQMGFAESQLPFDLVEEWIKKYPKASICTAEGVEKCRSVANFQDYHGIPEFRQAIARSCRKHEVVESYMILTEAKPPDQTS